jgi:predicted RecA/RadA family phage recombinase
MINYIQPGTTLTLTAPAGGVTSGDPVLIGGILAVPVSDAAATESFEGMTEGVFDLDKTSAQAWSAGDLVYWDAANDRADSSSAVGPLIGAAVAAAANPSSTGRVRLNGVTADVFAVAEGSPAPTSKNTAGGVTLTAAEVLTGVLVVDCAGAGRTYTLPTAALLVAAVPSAKVGDMLKLAIINGSDGAEDITLAAGSGGAFDANQIAASRIIGQNNSKLIHIRLTNVTASTEAYVVYC